MKDKELVGKVYAKLDKRFFFDTLKELIRVPTDVPLGPKTLMEPDDPKLVFYVQNIVRPILETIGAHYILEIPLNQLVVRAGSGEKKQSLLIQAYTVTQHHNLTRDPFKPRIAVAEEFGVLEPCIFGQGVSQNKVHMAAMLTLLKGLIDSNTQLQGTLYFAINNEGRSSHQCTEAILSKLNPAPQQGLLLFGTNMDITAGNRGRVDVYVHVTGKAAHSSRPSEGLSAIDGANEVINRIKNMKFCKTHPLLGSQHALVYLVDFYPVAPHTLPSYAKLIVDRRLLPGDNIDEAVGEIREAIGDLHPYNVVVEKGVYMLPALVDPGASIIQYLSKSYETIKNAKPNIKYLQGTFDAGGLCARGIPTIMWGASGRSGVLEDDFVPMSAAWDEVLVLSHLTCNLLG